MDSQPVVEHPPSTRGVAAIPSSERIRSFISASQGPSPLSNVLHMRTRHFPTGILRSTTSITIASGNETSGDQKDEERKPAPQNIRNSRSLNSEEIPSLPGRTESRSTSVIGAAPLTRAARRRRNTPHVASPPGKRRALTSKEDKPVALKSVPNDSNCSVSCCICMCDPAPGEIATIDGCDHKFCFNCIEKWSERENTCPLCKNRFNRINRVHKGKRKKGQKGTKKVKQRDQRADLNPNNGFDSLLANISGSFQPTFARLIFSGFPSSIDSLGSRQDGRGTRYRNAPTHMEDSPYSDNDEGSEGEAIFVNSMRRVNARGGADFLAGAYPIFASSLRGRPLRPVMFPTTPMATSVSSRVTRSYATNAHDVNAGGTADNALEIVDDSDDEVEVVDLIGRAV